MQFIKNYFTAEKNESILFVVVGIIAICLGIYFLESIKKPFYNGISYSIITIALIQIVVGTTVFLRSPKDIVRVENIIKNEPLKIKTEEIPRMKSVIKNFVLYRRVEIVLIIVGLTMMFVFSNKELIRGIGIGMFIQASIMLILDFFAERRGYEYLEFLKEKI